MLRALRFSCVGSCVLVACSSTPAPTVSPDAGPFPDARDAATDHAPFPDARDAATDDGTFPDVLDAATDTAPDADVLDATAVDATTVPIACTVVARSIAELNAALRAPMPGTTLCLADGSYADVTLSFVATGTEALPIIVTAQNPGRAVFTGRTQVSMGGAWATLRGFRLDGGQTAGSSLVELRAGSQNCDRCRVTEVAITDVDRGNAADTKWVSLYGQYDRVDHCVFSGKTNPGTLLVVWRSSGRADHHSVDHNLFANRPPLSSNGNEAIRVGTGAEASSDSITTIEDNLFDAMSGDAEVISVKSGANALRHNTLRRCAGQLTLRNGSGSTVDGNIILTESVADAGGIRVIGARHRIVNNYVEGVRSTSSARGGIVLVSGEAMPPAGGYALVEDVLVAHNTVVDCEQSLIFGADTNPLPPSRVIFANNLTAAARGAVVARGLGLASPMVFGNLFFGAPLSFTPSAGFREADARLARSADGLYRPTAGSPAIDAAEGTTDVTTDLDGQTRTGRFDVGADEVGAAGPMRRALTRADVGPLTWTIVVP